MPRSVPPANGLPPMSRHSAWQVLRAAGVPLGPPRRRPVPPSPAALREALRVVADHLDRLAAPRRDALQAWLGAWKRHWPRSFRHFLGRDGEDLRDRLNPRCEDPGRYLKLRRIALAHLARWL